MKFSLLALTRTRVVACRKIVVLDGPRGMGLVKILLLLLLSLLYCSVSYHTVQHCRGEYCMYCIIFCARMHLLRYCNKFLIILNYSINSEWGLMSVWCLGQIVEGDTMCEGCGWPR